MKSKKLFLICLTPMFLLSCLPPRAIFLGKPDDKDITRFNNAVIHPGSECFEFKKGPSQSTQNIKIDDWTKDIPFFLSLDSFVPSHNIRSLLIIQNDTVKYEFNSDNVNKKPFRNTIAIYIYFC